MDKIDYSKYNNEPIVTFSVPESEYQKRLKLLLVMEDVLNAYHIAKDSEDLGNKVIEIIECWELKE